MKKLGYVLALGSLLMVGVLGLAQAQVSMWFTDSAGNSVSELLVQPNSTFSIQVWMNTTAASKGFTAAIGYDTATAMGTSAVARDGKLALATGSVASDVAWGSSMASLFPTETAKAQAGLRAASGSASNSVRPYGLHLAKGSSSTDALGNTLIATINMKTTMATGEQYNMVIWDAGTGSTYTSVLNLGTTTYPRATDTLTVKVVPEPGSLMALGVGVMGLAGFAFRKRA